MAKKEVWDSEQWVKTATDVFTPFALKHGGVRVCRRSATTVVCNEKAKCKDKAKGKYKAKCKDKAVRKNRDARWMRVKSVVGDSKVNSVDNKSAGGDNSTRDNASSDFMFKTLETIGKGGDDKVYKVEVLSTKVQSAVGDLTQFCAVKVQTPKGHNLILDKQQYRELCIMMQLTKAASAGGGEMHIVPLIRSEKTHFNYHIFTPLYDCDLLSFIQAGRAKYSKYRPYVVRTISKQLLVGMEFMHKNRALHRYVNPRNAFVNNLINPARVHIVVGDFGAATMMARDVSSAVGDSSAVGERDAKVARCTKTSDEVYTAKKSAVDDVHLPSS